MKPTSKSFSSIFFFTLSGTRQEMAITHGELAYKNQSKALSFYANFLNSLQSFAQTPRIKRYGFKTALFFLKKIGIERLADHLPARFQEVANGLSISTRMPLEGIRAALVMPDMLMILSSLKPNVMKGLRWPIFGCTSLVGIDEQGHLLHGRNLDFPGGLDWTQHAAILEYRPKDGLKYVSMTALGIDSGGITAMNEAGITLALHMNYSRKVSLSGTPIVAIGEEIIRQARNLKEAEEILKSLKATSGWSFIIGSAYEGKSCVFEIDASGVTAIPQEGKFLARTNHYQSPRMQGHEYYVNDMRIRDSRKRYERAKTFLETSKYVSVEDIAFALGNHHDPEVKEEKGLGETICQPHTVTSVVMDPVRKTVWMAGGPSPTSIQPFFAYKVFENAGRIPSQIVRHDNDKDVGREYYARAFDSYTPYNNLFLCARYLESAVNADANCGLYALTYGNVLLKLQKFPEAEYILKRSLSCSDSLLLTQLKHLALGRAYDLQGKRDQACSEYQKCLQINNPSKILAYAAKGLNKTWKFKDQQAMVLDFVVGDIM